MRETHPGINAVIEKYKKLVYAIAIGVVNDAYFAEDISQDVFERLVKNADRILTLDEAKQIAYITVVTKNRAIDVYEKERTQGKLVDKITSDSMMAMDSMCGAPFVDEYGFSLETKELIYMLDDLERDIIVLKYGLGYTYREIAKLIDKKERYIYYKSKIC